MHFIAHYESPEKLVQAISDTSCYCRHIHSIKICIWHGLRYRFMVVICILYTEHPIYDDDSYSFTAAEIPDIRYGDMQVLREYAYFAYNAIKKAFPETEIILDLSGGDSQKDDGEHTELNTLDDIVL